MARGERGARIGRANPPTDAVHGPRHCSRGTCTRVPPVLKSRISLTLNHWPLTMIESSTSKGWTVKWTSMISKMRCKVPPKTNVKG